MYGIPRTDFWYKPSENLVYKRIIKKTINNKNKFISKKIPSTSTIPIAFVYKYIDTVRLLS